MGGEIEADHLEFAVQPIGRKPWVGRRQIERLRLGAERGAEDIVLAGDRVTMELSPYDLTKGRITFRHR